MLKKRTGPRTEALNPDHRSIDAYLAYLKSPRADEELTKLRSPEFTWDESKCWPHGLPTSVAAAHLFMRSRKEALRGFENTANRRVLRKMARGDHLTRTDRKIAAELRSDAARRRDVFVAASIDYLTGG